MTLLPLFSCPAVAGTEFPPQTTLSIGDLDLRTQAGAEALRRRIDRTVIAISDGDAPPPGSLIPPIELDAARARGREQANALISAARHPNQWVCDHHNEAVGSDG